MEIAALVVAGVALAWQLGEFVSRKTSTKIDDLIFQHPEIRDAIVALVEKLLEKRKLNS